MCGVSAFCSVALARLIQNHGPASRHSNFKLQQVGWIDERNIKIDLRFGGGDENRLQANAQELIGLLPDVTVANSAPAVMALARQTKTTPIVFANFFNPVGSGLVASLARPGGNVTGF